MATRVPNSVKQVSWTAMAALTLLITPALASSWRVLETLRDAKLLFTATLALNLDLGRAPTTAEWPNILVSAPSTAANWHGPYTLRSLRDDWGQPFVLRPGIDGPDTFGIYSFGVNGVDERGAGDDVSSRAGFDRRFYSLREPGDGLVLLVAPLLPLLGIIWLGFCIYRRYAAWIRSERH